MVNGKEIEFLLACVLIPALWGLVASWVYDKVTSRRVPGAPVSAGGTDSHPESRETLDPEVNEPMYYI